MSSWKTLCEFIDEHPAFNYERLKGLGLKPNALYQYVYYLTKAKYICKLENKDYLSCKAIGKTSIYKIREIGYDMELVDWSGR